MMALFLLSIAFSKIEAQTMRFKQTMAVDGNTGTEYQGSQDVRYITFSNNKQSFQFTNAQGQPINETGNVYLGSWSYCNQYFSVQDWGGASIASPTGRHYNPRIFQYAGMRGDKKVYKCRRTVCNKNNNQVMGYIDDYIYFNQEMTHFSIYSGGDERSNGIMNPDAASIELSYGNRILVYDADNVGMPPVIY